MGFLRIKYPVIFIILFIQGCSSSLIKVNVNKDLNPYPMYGRTSGRDFQVDRAATDSIRLVWEAEINGSFPGSSVTLYDNYVFTNDLSGRVFCFDFSSGKTLGQLKLKGSVFTAPVPEQSWIIFAAAQRETEKSILYFYDYSTGKTINEINIDGLILTELIKTDDGIIFNCDNGLAAKYYYSGELAWETYTGNHTHSSPAYDEEILFFGNDSGEILALNGEDGSILYRKKTGGPFFCGAAISGSTAFIGNDNGKLYAVDLKSGNILWEYQTGSRIMMVPAVDDDKIFLGNLNGDLISLKKNTGEPVWRNNTGGVLNISPLVMQNKLVIPDLNQKIYFADKEKGEITGVRYFDGRVKLTPVFHKNFLFIGYDNGILEAYEFY
jgi:outer membrane protein assembly factor BamB